MSTCDTCGLEVELSGPEWWVHRYNYFDAPCGIRLMDRYSVLPYPDDEEES